MASINEHTQAFRGHDEPVVWVRQEFVPDLADAFLEMRKQGMRPTIAETDGCEVLAELDRQPPDKTVVKKRYSAFFGTDLDATLASLRPAAIIVSGINTIGYYVKRHWEPKRKASINIFRRGGIMSYIVSMSPLN